MSLNVKKYSGVDLKDTKVCLTNFDVAVSLFIGAIVAIVSDIYMKSPNKLLQIVLFAAVSLIMYRVILPYLKQGRKEGYQDILIPTHLLYDKPCVTDSGGYCSINQKVEGDKKWGGYSEITTYSTVL